MLHVRLWWQLQGLLVWRLFGGRLQVYHQIWKLREVLDMAGGSLGELALLWWGTFDGKVLVEVVHQGVVVVLRNKVVTQASVEDHVANCSLQIGPGVLSHKSDGIH